MSRLIDVVAKSMELALVDRISLSKNKGTGNYSIYAQGEYEYYIGELEERYGFCYFNYYNYISTEKMHKCTIIALIKRFLLDNFKLTKLDEDIGNHIYYLITEK